MEFELVLHKLEKLKAEESIRRLLAERKLLSAMESSSACSRKVQLKLKTPVVIPRRPQKG